MNVNSSRGAAFADFNNDGRPDVVITNINDKPSLWRNDSVNLNHSVLLKLIGTRSNRSAIGARVRVVTGRHAQIGEVHSGDSLLSMSDLRLHFGLAGAARIDALEIRWPSGLVERLQEVPGDRIVYLQEGSEILRTEPYSSAHGHPQPAPRSAGARQKSGHEAP